MTPIGISILQTLKYSDHFGFPLTLSEIHSRLVGARSSRPLLITAINQMLKSKTISQTGDYYHLPGHASLVARRLKRAKFCAPRLRLAQTLAIKLSHTPGILAIYLTGSLAMSNSSVNDDIDFMIIAHSHHLWTTRFLLTLYTTILGLRRTPNSPRSSGKLCLNLYLTPMSYALPNHKQSLYTAYELVQAIPLFDPHNTRASLFAANSWIRHYLPNFPPPKITPSTIYHLPSTPLSPHPPHQPSLFSQPPRHSLLVSSPHFVFIVPCDPAIKPPGFPENHNQTPGVASSPHPLPPLPNHSRLPPSLPRPLARRIPVLPRRAKCGCRLAKHRPGLIYGSCCTTTRLWHLWPPQRPRRLRRDYSLNYPIPVPREVCP